jgi:hypothetical protein
VTQFSRVSSPRRKAFLEKIVDSMALKYPSIRWSNRSLSPLESVLKSRVPEMTRSTFWGPNICTTADNKRY